MKCTYCQGKTNVINTRLQKKLNKTWRRRECQKCQAVFTSIESVDMYKSFAVKQNKGFKPFLRDRLFLTINDSLKHRKSHIDDATALTDTVISQLGEANKNSGVISKLEIFSVTLKTLKRFDKTAATVYEALHTVK